MLQERVDSIKLDFASPDISLQEEAWEKVKEIVAASGTQLSLNTSIELLTTIFNQLAVSLEQEDEFLEEKFDLFNTNLDIFKNLLVFLPPKIFLDWHQKISNDLIKSITSERFSAYSFKRTINLRSYFSNGKGFGLDDDNDISALPLDDLRTHLESCFNQENKTKEDAVRFLLNEAVKNDLVDIFLIVTLIELQTIDEMGIYHASELDGLNSVIQEFDVESIKNKLKNYSLTEFSQLTLKRKIYLLWFSSKIGFSVSKEFLVNTIRETNTFSEQISDDDEEIKSDGFDSSRTELLLPMLAEMLTPNLLQLIQEEGAVYNPFKVVMQTTGLVDYLVETGLLLKTDFYPKPKVVELEKKPADFDDFSSHPAFLKELYHYCVSMSQSPQNKRELGFSFVFNSKNQVAFSLPILKKQYFVNEEDWVEGLREYGHYLGKMIAGHFHPPSSLPIPSFAYSAMRNDFVGDIPAFIYGRRQVSEELIALHDEKNDLVYVGSFLISDTTILGCEIRNDEDLEEFIYSGEQSPRSVVYNYHQLTDAANLEEFRQKMPEIANNLTKGGIQTSYYIYKVDRDHHTTKLVSKCTGQT